MPSSQERPDSVCLSVGLRAGSGSHLELPPKWRLTLTMLCHSKMACEGDGGPPPGPACRHVRPRTETTGFSNPEDAQRAARRRIKESAVFLSFLLPAEQNDGALLNLSPKNSLHTVYLSALRQIFLWSVSLFLSLCRLISPPLPVVCLHLVHRAS